MTPNERLGLHLWLTEEMEFVVSDTKRNLTIYTHLDYGFNVIVPDGVGIDVYDPNHVRAFVISLAEERRVAEHALHA